MPEYRTPLPGLLATMLETGVNRVLDLDDSARAGLDRLNGKHLQLDLEGVGISLFFAFGAERIRVSAHSDDQADTRVSGTPRALFAMAAPEELARWGSTGSPVSFTGDATLARDLERLFSRLDPDWEGGLSRIFGDVLGHQVASGLRSGVTTARAAAGNAGDMLSEYLQRAQGPLVNRREFDQFAEAVNEIRRATDQLEQKLATRDSDRRSK